MFVVLRTLVACSLLAVAGTGLAQAPAAASPSEKTPLEQAHQYARTRQPSTKVEFHDDIVYGKGVAGDLMLDIIEPKEHKGLLPGIMMVHGGGWIKGGRAGFKGPGSGIAENGYVIASIEYDLVPTAHYPQQIDETWQAWVWLNKHAREYGMDPNHIAVMGGSAGGELAALVALGVRRPAGAPLPKAAVLYSGALDLTEGAGTSATVNNYLGKNCKDFMDVCHEASPALADLKHAPPFYVGYGTADHTVPWHQAVEFIAKLKAAGIPVQEFRAEGGPHVYASMPKWADDNNAATIKFLKEYLR